MHDHLLRDIGLCIGAAFVMAMLARFLRQPALIGYIAAGTITSSLYADGARAGGLKF